MFTVEVSAVDSRSPAATVGTTSFGVTALVISSTATGAGIALDVDLGAGVDIDVDAAEGVVVRFEVDAVAATVGSPILAVNRAALLDAPTAEVYPSTYSATCQPNREWQLTACNRFFCDRSCITGCNAVLSFTFGGMAREYGAEGCCDAPRSAGGGWREAWAVDVGLVVCVGLVGVMRENGRTYVAWRRRFDQLKGRRSFLLHCWCLKSGSLHWRDVRRLNANRRNVDGFFFPLFRGFIPIPPLLLLLRPAPPTFPTLPTHHTCNTLQTRTRTRPAPTPRPPHHLGTPPRTARPAS